MGSVVNAIGDVAGSVGNFVGGIGRSIDPTNPNTFRARAPVNPFNASTPVDTFQANPQLTNLWAQQAQPEYTNFGPGGSLSNIAGAAPAAGTIARQQSLADQLQQQAAGTGGPTAAQAQFQSALNQAQGATASAIGSARGINPAQAARTIGYAQANQAQQAVSFAAALRAQEQQAAQAQLGGLTANIAGEQLGQQGQAIQALGTAGQLQNTQNANLIQNQQQQNAINATLAGYNNAANIAAMQANANVAALNPALNLQAQGLNAGVAAQNANLNLQAQGINAGVSGQNAQAKQSTLGGLFNAGAAGIMGALLNKGGEVGRNSEIPPWKMADGGPVYVPDYAYRYPVSGGFDPGKMLLQPLLAKILSSKNQEEQVAKTGTPLESYASPGSPTVSPWEGAGPLVTGAGAGSGPWAPAISPEAGAGDFMSIPAAAHGGDVAGQIPGAPKHPGKDVPSNDTVPIEASPGEIVLPLSVTQHPNAPEEAAKFVAMVQRHKKTDFGDVLAERAANERYMRAFKGREVPEHATSEVAPPMASPTYTFASGGSVRKYHDFPGEVMSAMRAKTPVVRAPISEKPPKREFRFDPVKHLQVV